ncbi:MAG: DUF2238 domain-containing protein [Bacillota bacterium]|nr:DUF2238 domain-containing protein [Bacillota bacterium]
MRLNNSFDEVIEKKKHIMLLIMSFLIYIWSAINPNSYLVWFLNTIPTLMLVSIVILTYKKFTFSTFVYFIIFIHVTILLIGAKYSYQLNPFFDKLTEIFDFSRNHYDRVGHFAQGLTPALMAKELLLRMGYMKRSKMFYFIIMCIALAISASYELFEFLFAKISNYPIEFVLAYQGDVWDTQWDMIMALSGALTGLIILGPLHDKYIKRMDK